MTSEWKLVGASKADWGFSGVDRTSQRRSTIGVAIAMALVIGLFGGGQHPWNILEGGFTKCRAFECTSNLEQRKSPGKLFSKSRGATVITLDEPFAFTLRGKGFRRNVTISHAISAEEDRAVVFVEPVQKVAKATAATLSHEVVHLSADFECVFEQGSSSSARTRLEVFRGSERNFTTAIAWRCPFPDGPLESFPTVKIVGPDEDVVGSGVFRLQQPVIPKVPLVSCTKLIIPDVGNDAHLNLFEYIRHYRELGVGHFVFYVDYDGIASHVLREFPDVTIIEVAPNFQETVLREKTPNVPLFMDLQKIVGTDCVWRTRHRAEWIMNMVDVDEYVIGTGNLPAMLRAEGEGFAAVVMRHRLVQMPYPYPLVHDGVRVSKKFMTTTPKSVVRPEEVDIMWVHAPTSFSAESKGREKFLNVSLLHFQKSHFGKFKMSDDEFEKADISSLPRQPSNAALRCEPREFFMPPFLTCEDL